MSRKVDLGKILLKTNELYAKTTNCYNSYKNYYQKAFIAQRIEQTRPKGKMGVQFPLRALKSMRNATKLPKKHLIRHHIHKITSNEYFRVLILRTIGNFLLLSSIFMILKTAYPIVKEEIKYNINRLFNKQFVVDDKKLNVQLQNSNVQKGLLGKTFKFNQVEVLRPVDPDFSIVIPKIAANAKILANIDASNENIYLDALNKGVAHALGTAFPGESGHIFLFCSFY